MSPGEKRLNMPIIMRGTHLDLGPVRLSYNLYFSTYFFSVGTVFFSHNKSAGTVFRLVFSAKRTGPKLLVDVASAKEREYIGHFMLSSCRQDIGRKVLRTHLAEPLKRRSLPPRHAYLGLCM